MLDNYVRVRLLTNKYLENGVSLGAFGYVIENYGNGDYEVEFSKPDGTTYAQITARAEELAVAELAPTPAVTIR